MLFNTLTFAKFFAIVFLVSWVLVNRRYVLLLPWIAVASYVALGQPSTLGLGLTALALLFTVALVRQATDEHCPRLRFLAAAVVVNYLALTWLTYSDTGLDPLLLGLRTLGIAVTPNWAWVGPSLLLSPLSAAVLLRSRDVRKIFLLLASYVFYAAWSPAFVTLIWLSTATDWFAAQAMHATLNRRARTAWLVLSLAVNLGLLGFFKYFYFLNESAALALGWAGLGYRPWALEIVLPVGISFYTFQTLSYTIDVYRGRARPWPSALDFALYVTFFPQLVAGPIVRPNDLLPQLAAPPRWSTEEASEGLFLVTLGLLKKVAIGDYLALNLVDRVFDAPTQYSALECYTGVLGYAVQIYCDFSGYTDIAIGAALLLGIRMQLNFNAPYKATEIIDFWRRWHISLSSWLRDYLYISLGGNRRGRARTYFNLMATMLLGGLWHGAGWTFVVWGGLHGWALSVTRMVDESSTRGTRLAALLGPAAAAGPTFGLVMCVLSWTYQWSLFRAFTLIGWALGGALAIGALYHAWAKRNRAASRSATPLYDERRDLEIPGLPRTMSGRIFAITAAAATFHVVCAGWIFFRAQSFQAAAAYFTQLLTLTTYHPNLHWKVVTVLIIGLGSHWVPERLYMDLRERFVRLPAPAQGVALFAAALALREMASAEAVPFVYFQF